MVNISGLSPSAETLEGPESSPGAKMIWLSAPQLEPKGNEGISHKVAGTPPLMETFIKLPSAQNPI